MRSPCRLYGSLVQRGLLSRATLVMFLAVLLLLQLVPRVKCHYLLLLLLLLPMPTYAESSGPWLVAMKFQVISGECVVVGQR